MHASIFAEDISPSLLAKLSLGVLAASMIIGSAGALTTDKTNVSDAVIELRQLATAPTEQDQATLNKRIHDVYNNSALSRLDDSTRAKLATDELRLAYDAANIASFYTNDANFSHDQARSFAELQRRNAATDLQARETLGSLVAARDFAAANQFALSHPATNPSPVVLFVAEKGRNDQGRSLLSANNDGKTLTQISSELHSGTEILVIAHPMCHFTQNAARAIEADRALSRLFAEHSRWMAPQGRDLDFLMFSRWNQQHPFLHMTIVYRQTEWPELSDWDTPLFYFMRNGHVIAKVAGWPREGRKEALIKAAAKVGLRPAPPTEQRSERPPGSIRPVL